MTTPGDATSHTALLDAFDSAIHKTADLMAGVGPEQATRPTPCPDYDVQALCRHLAQWVRVTAAGFAEEPRIEEPEAHEPTDAAAEFRASADHAVEAARRLGLDRDIRFQTASMPGPVITTMMLGEYVAHGWDLAVATGQPVPFIAQEASLAQQGLAGMLTDEYRGEGKDFGRVVEAPADADEVARFICFTGRDVRDWS